MSEHVTSAQAIQNLVRDFAFTAPRRTAAFVAALVAAGLLEGLSVMTMLPFFVGAGSPSGQALAALGLQPDLKTALGLVVVMMSLKGVISWWATLQVAQAVTDVTAKLRSRLISAVLRAQWSYFTSQPLGLFTNALSGEADRTGKAYEALCQILAYAIQVLVYLALALLLSWKAAVLAIVLGAGLTLILRRLARLDRNAGREQTRLFKLLAIRVADGLRGIKPLKAMAREAALAQFLQSNVLRLNTELKRAIIYWRAVANFGEPIIAVALAAVIYAGSEFFALSMSALLIMAALFFRILTRLGHIQQAWFTALHEENAYRSLKQLLQSAEQAQEMRHTGTLPKLPATIELTDVSFNYGATRILDTVTLRLEPGTITTVAGPSGSGKTTLTELIVGLRQPSSGRITVGGRPLDDIDTQKWRESIGYVPQEFSLFNDTVLANLTLGDHSIAEERAIEALQQADAWNFVQKLPQGLATPVGEAGLELSGGQRQRIALARALLRKPALLILDEATSSLDPDTEAGICRTIQTLKQDLVVLVVTHQPGWLSVADNVYRLTGDHLS